MKWKIGKIIVNNQVGLAPMAGISNPAYLKICQEMGIGFAITELISSEAIIRNNKKTFDMLKGIDTLTIPVGIQLFGASAENLAEAAKKITSLYKNVFIDINMGCPVPKVAVRSQAGAALLKDPDNVFKIVSAVVKAVSVPVTVKIRSGWDVDHINAVEIAQCCQQAGAKAICIHARTRSQGYSGTADWDVIRKVKAAVSIPVIGNGDITTAMKAKEMLSSTGCDAVMIGRAALGNPWLLQNAVNLLEGKNSEFSPSAIDKLEMCLKHLRYLQEFKPEKLVCLEIRNHIAWYLKGVSYSNEIKKKIYQCKSIRDIILILENYKEVVLHDEEKNKS